MNKTARDTEEAPEFRWVVVSRVHRSATLSRDKGRGRLLNSRSYIIQSRGLGGFEEQPRSADVLQTRVKRAVLLPPSCSIVDDSHDYAAPERDPRPGLSTFFKIPSGPVCRSCYFFANFSRIGGSRDRKVTGSEGKCKEINDCEKIDRDLRIVMNTSPEKT